MKYVYLFFTLLLFIVGCEQTSTSTENTNNTKEGIRPPTWIQGIWEHYDSTKRITIRIQFTDNNMTIDIPNDVIIVNMLQDCTEISDDSSTLSKYKVRGTCKNEKLNVRFSKTQNNTITENVLLKDGFSREYKKTK